jgi:hypothetical protein
MTLVELKVNMRIKGEYHTYGSIIPLSEIPVSLRKPGYYQRLDSGDKAKIGNLPRFAIAKVRETFELNGLPYPVILSNMNRDKLESVRYEFIKEVMRVYDSIPPEERDGYFYGKILEGLKAIDPLVIAEYQHNIGEV